MASDNSQNVKVPGSWLERFIAFVWYGVISSMLVGPRSILSELLHKVKKPNYEALPRRTGEIAILTGGTRGLGAKVLKKLLQLDFTVILGVRNVTAGQKAVENVRKCGIKTGRASFLNLDLKSLTSVRTFAQNVLMETDRIDLIINNAGIMFEPYEVTEDGFELHFQVNYLSHFLLTQLLLPKLKLTAAANKKNCRVVNVSSEGHMAARRTNPSDFVNPRVYSSFKAYYDSKLSQILFTKYLDSTLEGTNVSVFALHPGVIPTELYNSLAIFGKIAHLMKPIFRSIDDGANEIMYVATSPDLLYSGGSYICNSKAQRPNELAEDLGLQKMLWDISEDCVNHKN